MLMAELQMYLLLYTIWLGCLFYIQVLTNMSSFKGDYCYQYNEDNGVE